MTKDKTTELSDTDLDAAQGGFGSWGGVPISTAKANPKRRDAFNGAQGDEPAMVRGKTGIIAADEGETI